MGFVYFLFLSSFSGKKKVLIKEMKKRKEKKRNEMIRQRINI